jgi:hypothetical protein
MANDTEHQNYVELAFEYFQERGITCEDYETLVGQDDSKRPDLILPDFETFLEVKTFKPKQRELQEEQRIGQEVLSGKVSAYGLPTFLIVLVMIYVFPEVSRISELPYCCHLFTTYILQSINKALKNYYLGKNLGKSPSLKMNLDNLFW